MSSIGATHTPHLPSLPMPSTPTDTPAMKSAKIPVKVQESTLVDDGVLTARQSVLSVPISPTTPLVLNDTLVLETGNTDDTIRVSQLQDGQINVDVNARSYVFKVSDHGEDGAKMSLHIKSNGGNDKIKIDANVKLPVKVEAGDGDDDVQAGGGETSLFGGQGNDTLRLGSGTGYAEGNEGDDVLIGGTGNHAMYGNAGRDRMYAGAGPAGKKSYMDGGTGADQMYAGNGHTVMNGGRDDDLMVGGDRTTFYTGHGKNKVWSSDPDDLIYGNASDTIKKDPRSTFNLVDSSQSGKQGFTVEGSPQFKQRVEDDFEMMRGSPNGQKMLNTMDVAAVRNGAPVKIIEAEADGGSSHTFRETKQYKKDKEGKVLPGSEVPLNTYIHNGARNAPAENIVVHYNRSHALDKPKYFAAPLTVLYHELAHAYNSSHGTMLKGETEETVDGQPPTRVGNNERQVVGLTTDTPPFDFDNDPTTPPTTTNPKPFTENGLNEEMGSSLRTAYTLS